MRSLIVTLIGSKKRQFKRSSFYRQCESRLIVIIRLCPLGILSVLACSLEAILHYLAMYDNAVIIAADLWNQLPTFLQDVTYNPGALRDLQAEVRTMGFPPVIITYLSDIAAIPAHDW